MSANLQKLSMKLTIGAVVFNIALNLLIIPKYGYLGASATTVATETSLVCTDILFLRRYGYRFRLQNMILPPFFGLVVISRHFLVVAVLWRAFSCSNDCYLTFVCDYIVQLGLDKDDKRLIVSLLKYRRPASTET